MIKSIKKIEYNIKNIRFEWSIDKKQFSYKLADARLKSKIFSILGLHSISMMYADKKNAIILENLKGKYGYIFQNYNKCSDNCVEDNSEDNFLNQSIWICWLDGLESAPPLVKRCISSIYEHSNGHPVNLITMKNIENYIELPEFIVNKFFKGEINPAHFSDIIRIMLLKKYGGLWLDATIFCAKDIPNEYFEMDFFTCKSEIPTPGCISKNQWTTFCLGGRANNILFNVLNDFFIEYWTKEICAIDYLFFDDAIELARNIIPQIKKIIDLVPINNTKRDELILQFCKPFDEFIPEDFFNNDTIIYKLGYREEIFLQEKNSKGKDTVYFAYINNLF